MNECCNARLVELVKLLYNSWIVTVAGSSQRLFRMIDGLNFKEFVLFLSAFSSRATLQHKVEWSFFLTFIQILLSESQIRLSSSEVSESQFSQVLNIELDQIIEACKMLRRITIPSFPSPEVTTMCNLV
ncbi:hypothetical protein LXL04_033209 [Taraxacum kok-saghyz]